jgi:hypothetical protein
LISVSALDATRALSWAASGYIDYYYACRRSLQSVMARAGDAHSTVDAVLTESAAHCSVRQQTRRDFVD